MIRRIAVAAGLVAFPAAATRLVVGRGAERLLAGPRTTPDEAALRPELDALGGEVVRVTSRDGLRLTGRWLPAETVDGTGIDGWKPDPHEAILLLHGWSGSIAPDLVEYGPFLRRTAGVLGIDFRGHGGSDAGPTTFGASEVEDVAGALAWLAERGISRVALFGTSMGGMTALASIVVLGDGSMSGADADLDAPAHDLAPNRPAIVGCVIDSVAPELTVAVANRMRTPLRRFLAERMFEAASRRVGVDLRATEPIRIISLVDSVPLLLIRGEADATVPLADADRLAAAAGSNADTWTVPGAGHSAGHRTDPAAYERRVETFIRAAFAEGRGRTPIIGRLVPENGLGAGGQEGD